MTPSYTDLQLDALREVANIGSGTAGTALSSMVGRSIDVSVPSASALPLADAVDTFGAGEDEACSIGFLLLPTPASADELLSRLGVGG